MELQQRYYVNVNALTSQTRAMTVEAEAEARPRRKLGDRADAEPTITRPNRGRGTWFETEAAGCRGRDATDKKLSRGKPGASRTTPLTHVRGWPMATPGVQAYVLLLFHLFIPKAKVKLQWCVVSSVILCTVS